MLELANQFNNQNILIYGFGKSGRACFKYLRKNNKIEIYDDKKSSIPKNLKKNSINKTKLTSVNFDRIVVSPGIDINKCTLKKYLSKNKSKIDWHALSSNTNPKAMDLLEEHLDVLVTGYSTDFSKLFRNESEKAFKLTSKVLEHFKKDGKNN